jgi:hypothetical protein
MSWNTPRIHRVLRLSVTLHNEALYSHTRGCEVDCRTCAHARLRVTHCLPDLAIPTQVRVECITSLVNFLDNHNGVDICHQKSSGQIIISWCSICNFISPMITTMEAQFQSGEEKTGNRIFRHSLRSRERLSRIASGTSRYCASLDMRLPCCM